LVISDNTIKNDFLEANLAIQEFVRTVAKSSRVTLEMENGISIEHVTKEAFVQLGEDGVISATKNHSCSECTHEYKETADRITGDDPVAVLCVDENHDVLALAIREDADLAVQDAAHARLNAQLAAQASDDVMDVDPSSSSQSSSSTEEASPVTLVVMDGVVIGPTHCAFDDCTEELKNA
jgi:hypothetical protein